MLQFSVNDQIMGSELTCAPDEARIIRMVAVGTAPITQIELISNGSIMARHRRPIPEDSVTLTFHDNRELDGEIYYYMRIIQEDGHQAWSSPIWVTPVAS